MYTYTTWPFQSDHGSARANTKETDTPGPPTKSFPIKSP